MVWNYFTAGDSFSLSSKGEIAIKTASYKDPTSGRGRSKTTTDIFSSPNRNGGRQNPLEFVVIGTGLVDSSDSVTYGETYETDPCIYSVNFKKTSDTKGFVGVNPDGDKRYQIQKLVLDIVRTRNEEREAHVPNATTQQQYFLQE